ncbi:hypothetical protein [Dactylosporangium sp. CA-139066]|uniref:hypothetical protein n=1 Tax=Dactylosporangium sp. CA-139066 TaxID=3239930 RepID=UPI003D8D5F5C
MDEQQGEELVAALNPQLPLVGLGDLERHEVGVLVEDPADPHQMPGDLHDPAAR